MGEVERSQGGEVSNGSGEMGQLVGGEVQSPQRPFHCQELTWELGDGAEV